MVFPQVAGMILGIGTDLLDVARMERELARGSAGFREEVFTPAEIAWCQARRYPARHFAARFAAKEALLKALPAAGVPVRLRDVEIARTHQSAPRLVLHGSLKEAAERLGVRNLHVSLSHTGRFATASVLLEG
ncbi:MAG: holo-ACP synthase [Thermoanaerobaculia bacterium]